MSKYFSNWSSYEDVKNDLFCGSYYNDYRPLDVPEGFPSEDEILYAAYWPDDYSGYARILYMHDGKVCEWEGSHCSCNGLEGQWPAGMPHSEVTWEALNLRSRERSSDYKYPYTPKDAHEGFWALVDAHLPRA